jgi:hypothetical protein
MAVAAARHWAAARQERVALECPQGAGSRVAPQAPKL